MTAIPHAHPAESLVRAGVVGALATRGVTVTSVEMLFDGQEWSVTVSHHAPGMSENDVRVAVWTAVLNYTAVFDVPAPAEGVRVSIDDLPAEHPEVVPPLVAELCDRDGVVSVPRYGPAALVAGAPSRDELRVKPWLQRHLPR